MIITNDLDECVALSSLSSYFKCHCNMIVENLEGNCDKCEIKKICYFLPINLGDCEIMYKEDKQ